MILDILISSGDLPDTGTVIDDGFGVTDFLKMVETES